MDFQAAEKNQGQFSQAGGAVAVPGWRWRPVQSRGPARGPHHLITLEATETHIGPAEFLGGPRRLFMTPESDMPPATASPKRLHVPPKHASQTPRCAPQSAGCADRQRLSGGPDRRHGPGACQYRPATVDTILPDEDLEKETKSREEETARRSPEGGPRNGLATRPPRTCGLSRPSREQALG